MSNISLSYVLVISAMAISAGISLFFIKKSELHGGYTIKLLRERMTKDEQEKFDAENISKSKDASKQRETFALLSKNIYELTKVSKQDTPIYYQHCPMFNNGKGANWLSKENVVKNPYFGSKMLTCGSTVETIGNK